MQSNRSVLAQLKAQLFWSKGIIIAKVISTNHDSFIAEEDSSFFKWKATGIPHSKGSKKLATFKEKMGQFQQNMTQIILALVIGIEVFTNEGHPLHSE